MFLHQVRGFEFLMAFLASVNFFTQLPPFSSFLHSLFIINVHLFAYQLLFRFFCNLQLCWLQREFN